MRDLRHAEAIVVYHYVNPAKWAMDAVEPVLGITLDPWQRDFLRNESKRILLNCHRQSGKSTAVAIRAIHTAHFKPKRTVVIISPTQRQSSELHHTIRGLIKTIGIPLTVDNVASTELANGSRIISLPGSPWTIRGYPADVVIVDEAAGVEDDVFAAVSPMLLATDGTMIVLSTPQGQAGRFWEMSNSPDWSKHTITVSDNPRMQTPERREFLEHERADLGTRLYEQEYECRFLGEAEGGLFKREWIRYADAPFGTGAVRVRYWDCAATSEKKAQEQGRDADWTVGTLIAKQGTDVIIEDVIRMRVSPKETETLIGSTARRDGPDTSIRIEQEGGSAGADVMELVWARVLAGYDFRGDRVTGPKTVRAQALSAAIERGEVRLLRAEWNKAWIDEVVSFPLGAHDDQVDSAAGAYRYLCEAGEEHIYFF